MYQRTKTAFKNALFFFQSANTSNLRALLNWSENAPLGNIFTFLCCNCDTKHTCKKIISIDWVEFLREWCEYVWVSFGWIYSGRRAKTAILLFVGFLKIKNSPTSFSLIFENSLPKGFSWQNMKKSVISVLKINSRYLQSPALKRLMIKTLQLTLQLLKCSI